MVASGGKRKKRLKRKEKVKVISQIRYLAACSIQKRGEIFGEYFFQTLEAFFPHKGVFVTKVMKANIIAFIKTKILRPVLSVKKTPFTFF